MLDRATGPLLDIKDLHAWYGESHILHGTTFNVNAGEVVTLLGRNGAGKTTTLKSVMGIVGNRKGSVKFEGRELINLQSDVIARAGLAFCPEERGIFASLDVEENLMLPPQVRPGGLSREQIFELFPNLRERLKSQGTKLSGGEQQMLAIGRALMSSPAYLLLDEPSLGLSPVLTSELFKTVRKIADKGVGVLLVEQNALQSLKIAEQAYLVETGRVVDQGPAQGLRYDASVIDTYLGGRKALPAPAKPKLIGN